MPEDHHVATRPAWLKQLIPENYSGRIPPSNNGCPAIIYLKCIPVAFGEISVQAMTIEVDMSIFVSWIDNRLRMQNLKKNDFVVLERKEIKELWTPVVEFNNCLHCSQLAVHLWSTKLWLSGGRLQFQERAANKLQCNFDLSAYPMDTQVCFVELQLGDDQHWTVRLQDETDHSNLTSLSHEIRLTEFKLVKLYARNCSKGFMSHYMSCVSFGFVIKRQVTYHLMLTYCPSLLIVILSWISFWLDADASAPRVTIGLTSLLTLATQFVNAQKNLPAVSYVKAIDIWMFVCMFMVFGSLLEFAIANNVARIKKKRSVFPLKSVPNYRIEGGRVFPKRPPVLSNPKPETEGRNVVDKIAQILFPITFVTFNVLYWGYYCYIL